MTISLQIKKATLFCIAFSAMFNVNAQEATVIRTQGVADAKKEVNFMQIALVESYNKPAAKPIQFIGNRKARVIPEMDADLTGIVKTDPFPAYSFGNKTNAAVSSIGPVKSFNGLNDNSTSIPPDVNGTVGPNHTIVTLNTQVRIQDKNGVNLSTVSLNSFWSPIGGLTSTYDPKALYDHVANRWMIVSSAEPQSNNSCTLLAVSKTDDPTQGWNMYKVDVDPTNVRWVDFPSIGFNDRWIVVQMNLFPMPGNSTTSHQIYVWDKADVYSNGPGTFTKFEVTNEATAVACPSIHYDNSTDRMFLIRSASGNSGGKGTLTMRTITGPTSAPVMSAPVAIQSNNTWATGAGTNGNFNPQLGSTNLINAGDHRMRQVVVRDGRIWATHAIFLPQGNPNRSSVQWWELDTLGNIIQRNIIDDATGNRHYNYPSIAVNNKNDVLIGYSSFSKDQYASAGYSLRRANDPINTFRDEYTYKFGENTYFKDFGAGRNRWGDYSNTVVDPTNDSTFWTIQEYAGGTINTWATWWAEVDPDANVVDFSVDNNYLCPDESITFTSLTPGANILWSFQGGNPASSTLANPTVNYTTSGKYRVTLDVDGKSQTKEGYVIVLTNPIRVVNKNNVLPCTGNTITLTASQSNGVYLWNTGATTRAIQVTESGTYYCDITAPNGLCSRRSDSVVLNFTTLNVTLADFNSIDLNAAPIQLTGGQPSGGVYTGPGVSNGIFNPKAAGQGTHTINYTFTSPEGCSATASKTIVVTNLVGLNSNAKINAFSVTPNPSKGIVNLNLVAESNASLKIQVIDQLGRIVWSRNYDDNSTTIKKEIDLSSLPKGSYFIKADMGDASETQKLIIE
jgi:Secretion system C-terminal sorting domain/PKD domain